MLASADDVARALGLESAIDLSAAQTFRAPSLLARASYLFQKAADRLFIADTYSVRLKMTGGRVRLPETPVTNVASVMDDRGSAVTYTRDGAWLSVENYWNHENSFTCYGPPASGLDAFVTVTYTGGGIPDVVKFAVAAMAARYLNVDPQALTGAKSVNLITGPFQSNITYNDWASDTMCLSDDDQKLAETFRYRGTQVVVQRP